MPDQKLPRGHARLRRLRFDRPHAWEDGKEALEGDHASPAGALESGINLKDETFPRAGLVVSGPSDTHDLATAPIDLDNCRFKQTRWLTGQPTPKGHAPDRTRARSRSFGFDAVRLKRNVLTRDFDGAILANLSLLGETNAGRS